MRFLAFILFAGLLAANGVSAEAPASFALGTQLYQLGEYEKAADVLRATAATHAPSAGLMQNLGNAEWKCGHTGPAILAWERAAWLDPSSTNARGNLRFARKSALLEAPELAWYEICSTWLPVNAWAWLATGSFWLAAALIFVPGIFHWRKSSWQQALAAASFTIFLLTLPAMFGVFTRAKIGVISRPVPLRLTPTAEAQATARLAAGETVRLDHPRGKYVFVRASAMAGWMERSQLDLIAP
jgi:tetratricopeptide (TPR) repeat protein